MAGLAADVAALLECPVCMEPYDSPRALPCQHTLCLPCLLRLQAPHGLRCPECRTNVPLGEAGVRGLPLNVTMARLLEVARTGAGVRSSVIRRAADSLPPSTSPKPLADQSPVTYADKGEPVGEIRTWEGQCGPAGFTSPVTVGVCPSTGLIFVTDQAAQHCIHVFKADGVWLRTFGRTGTGDAEFQAPWGLTVNVRRELYVCDVYNHRLQVFTGSGHYVRQMAMPGGAPTCVCEGPGGGLYVSSATSAALLLLSRDGDTVLRLGSPGTEPGQFNSPTDVIVTDQKVIVNDYGNRRVQVLDLDGAPLHCIREEGLVGAGEGAGEEEEEEGRDQPAALALSPRGEVLVLYSVARQVRVYRAADAQCVGGFTLRGAGAGQLSDIACRSDGRILIVNQGARTVLMY